MTASPALQCLCDQVCLVRDGNQPPPCTGTAFELGGDLTLSKSDLFVVQLAGIYIARFVHAAVEPTLILSVSVEHKVRSPPLVI